MSKVTQSGTALEVFGIGKCFPKYKSNFQRFLTWFAISIEPTSKFWAIQEVSFKVSAGQAIAFIGQNGAGKSTLLKLIAGILNPSVGSIIASGKIHAILELGLGFNPDLSGRQNVFLAGGLMGISTDELRALIPEIEKFAEIGKFFDEPLRVYSSGMQARLAFSVATAVRPDILIIDEVLSVGDAYFQHKSFARIRQFREQGTAIILVTHSLADVRALCDRVFLIEKGSIVKEGLPVEVIDFYNGLVAKKEHENYVIDQSQSGGNLRTRSGTGEALVDRLSIVSVSDSNEVAIVHVGQILEFRAKVRICRDLDELVLGFKVTDRYGQIVWGSNTWHAGQSVKNVKISQIYIFTFRFTCTIGPGDYSLSTALHSGNTHFQDNYELMENGLIFEVSNSSNTFFIGGTWLDGQFKVSTESKND